MGTDAPTLVTSEFLRTWRLPQPEGSKHSRGHVLVIGGGASIPGATMLAGLAALRVGAGVLAMAVADSAVAATAAAVPEASVAPVREVVEDLGDGEYVLVGPGLDDAAMTADVLAAIADQAGPDTTFVLDAYALGVLADSPHRQFFAGRTVLTPNSSELERLIPSAADLDDLDDAAAAAAVAEEYDAVVAFHGSIATPDGRTWRTAAGHPGLGTSGSGDVLAGAVVGLLARGAEAAQAACWATYLHAMAGERLAARVGRLGFLARELCAQLPVVLTETEA
jgi:ADP-dependent NAD(P)H-hydrate dehydratase